VSSQLELECQYEYYLRSVGKKGVWDDQTFDMKKSVCGFIPRILSKEEKQAAVEWYQEQGL
jgi:hypothetical protein